VVGNPYVMGLQFFRKGAYTVYDVPWFVEWIDFSMRTAEVNHAIRRAEFLYAQAGGTCSYHCVLES
jgi:hypothetical protein